MCRCLTEIFVVEVVELQIVDLHNHEADLVVELEWVDLEDTLRYCKHALSSEMIADSEILVAADCSTSTDEFDDLICHKPDNRPFLFHFCLFDLFGLLDSDTNSESDSDSMTKRSIDLSLLTWSCPFLLTCPSVVENRLRTLLILFLSEGLLTFAFAFLDMVDLVFLVGICELIGALVLDRGCIVE